MNEIEAILAEKEKTHGPYEEKARIIQMLKDVVRLSDGWVALEADQKESIEMIFHKIGRIVAGDASCPDHWKDISGYGWLPYRRLISRRPN